MARPHTKRDESLIAVPFQYAPFYVDSKHPIYTRPVIAHEYGHLVFNVNLNAGIKEINLKQVRNSNPDLDKTILPYEEFFADLISVVSLKDKNAVSNSIKFTRLFQFRNGWKFQAQSRAFDSRFRAKNFTADDAHALLSPTRQHIGKWYLNNIRYDSALPHVIPKVFDAVVSEIQARIADPSLKNLTPAEINQRLIAAIDLALEQSN